MFIDFEMMPDYARTWVFQADRKISDQDKASIDVLLKEFTSQWVAHGQSLRSSYKIADDYFIILAVDEAFNEVSGCSIDSSFHIIKEVENKTGIGFFNRNLIPFQTTDGIILISSGELVRKYAEGVWNGRTNTFNTLANTVGSFKNSWVIPAEKTWLKRYMKVNPHDSVAR